MKKTLLILSVGFSGMLCAQNAPVQPSKVTRAVMLMRPSNSAKAENSANASSTSSVSTHTNKAVRHVNHNLTTANKVEFATAENMFGVLTAECTQVTANQDLNMVAFTHREDMSLPSGSGAYETDYSLNYGTTWDADSSMDVVFKNISTRYPNGIVLNPVGNTIASQAYAITNGPHTNGTAWDSNAFGSIRLDGANTNEQEFLEYPNVTSSGLNVFSPPHFMSVTNDSIVHSVEYAWSLNSGSTDYDGFYGGVVNTGTWSGTTHSVTWANTVLKPNLASYDGSGITNDSDAEVQQVAMAWSQDGSVGYVVFFGNLDSAGYNYASLQPIVYKSTNHGASWAMMPMFNFGNIPNLVKYLIPAIDSNIKLPFWDIAGDSGGFYDGHDVDLTVDANYNLHIFGAIESGAIANPDSGGYSFNPSEAPSRYLYDVYTTSATGGWAADLLDSLKSPEGIDASNTLWTSAANGSLVWGARIQASRSTDGTMLFCTWLDDYAYDGEILSPDITTIGIDVTTNLKTYPSRVTTDGDNYFLMVSDIAIPNGTCWDIPCVVALDPAAPDEGITPVEFDYVQGATLCDTAFHLSTSGINEVANVNSGFSITPNFPNPFANITNFNITLSKESVVSVDIFNLLGEKVGTLGTQQMTSGTHEMTINGSEWNTGIYFYRVTVDGQSITQKMAVQK
jgi:hypothetical protein